MGRTACTEPQCLYKGALYLYFYQIPAQYVSAVTALDSYTGNGIMVTDRTTLVIWPAAHSSVL